MKNNISCDLEQSFISEHLVSSKKSEAESNGYDYLAPDKSEIRLLPNVKGGGLCHCSLPVGAKSIPVYHKTVEEIWYVIKGEGEIWRKSNSKEVIEKIRVGSSVNIPRGVAFQFINTGDSYLKIIIATIPRWPGEKAGEEEAVSTIGYW